MDLLTLIAKLTVDDSEYQKGLTSAEKKAQDSEKKLKSGMGKIAMAGAAAVTAFAAASVKTGMEFDKSMSQVAATMGKTMDELESEVGSVDTAYGQFTGNLREYAKFMGANTVFSATQASEALNYMALAGYDAEKSMKTLPSVLNLAAAGGMDLARASDMITDSESALGLSADQTARMIDQMAKTASKSNTSVEQLGDAILTVGGTATFMAGGTTELNQVLGLLADNGIKGSEAGTHLRNMLLKLSSPTKEGAEQIEKLGLKIFDSEGKMRSFSEIFPELNKSLSKLTDEQKLQALSDIFNTRDIASVNALLSTTGERWDELQGYIEQAWYTNESMNDSLEKFAGISLTKITDNLKKLGISQEDFNEILGYTNGNADDFKDALLEAADAGVKEQDIVDALGGDLESLQKAFDNTQGSAQAMSDTQLDNLSGDITLLQSAFEGLQIKISDDLNPVMRDMVQWLTGVIDTFDTWAPIVIGLGTAFGVLAIALNFGTIVSTLATTFSTLWTVLSANPIGVVIAILAGLVTAIITAWNTNEDFRNAVITAWEAIKSGAQKLGEKFNAVKDKIVEGWESLKEKAGQLADKFEDIKQKITEKIETARDKVHDAIEKIKSFFNFEWSLPKLKMPHVSITGGFSIMPPSTPKFSVDWYKKAYNGIVKFPQNTVLQTADGLKGFSDGVGSEVLMSEKHYFDTIREAELEGRTATVTALVSEIRTLKDAILGMGIVLDTGAIAGAVSPTVDSNLGSFAVYNSRGM